MYMGVLAAYIQFYQKRAPYTTTWLLEISEERAASAVKDRVISPDLIFFLPVCIDGRVGTCICVYNTAGMDLGRKQVESKPYVGMGPAMEDLYPSIPLYFTCFFILFIKKEIERLVLQSGSRFLMLPQVPKTARTCCVLCTVTCWPFLLTQLVLFFLIRSLMGLKTSHSYFPLIT